MPIDKQQVPPQSARLCGSVFARPEGVLRCPCCIHEDCSGQGVLSGRGMRCRQREGGSCDGVPCWSLSPRSSRCAAAPIEKFFDGASMPSLSRASHLSNARSRGSRCHECAHTAPASQPHCGRLAELERSSDGNGRRTRSLGLSKRVRNELRRCTAKRAMNSQAMLRFKLSAIVTAVTVCVMSVLGIFVMRGIQDAAMAQSVGALRNQNRLVENLLASTSEVLKLEAEKRGRVFEARFPGVFTLDPRITFLLDGHPTPELRHDGVRINGDYRQVDAFSRDTGGDVATVFARSGDDFIRVSTSLTDEHGARAVATRLERTHPGYAKLMRGEPYLGLARLFGTYYMTKYWPIKDGSASVIGVLFIGMNLDDALAALKDKIRPGAAQHNRLCGYHRCRARAGLRDVHPASCQRRQERTRRRECRGAQSAQGRS